MDKKIVNLNIEKRTNAEKRVISEDLDFIQNSYIYTVGGKHYLGTENRAYNVSHVIKESDFVDNWLIYFAIGSVYGTNYFPTQRWNTFSNQGKALVGVSKDDDKKDLILIIPPITGVDLTPSDYAALKVAVKIFSSNTGDTQKTLKRESNAAPAKELIKLMSKNYRSLTDLIPEEFFKKYGIIPKIEKNCIYVRDVINADKKLHPDNVKRFRDILYRRETGKNITQEEINFCREITKNEMDWCSDKNSATGSVVAPNENQSDAGVENDPFSC